MKRSVGILLLFLLATLFSCIKDEFTRPVDVSFEFWFKNNLQKEKELVEFSSGKFVVHEISFSGYREQAEDYFFTSELLEPVIASLENGHVSQLLRFDIPQGVYERIELEITMDGSDTVPGLLMEGVYKSLNQGNIPLVFTYPYHELLKVKARSKGGKGTVTLSTDNPATARVTIDSDFMFLLVNSRMLESADITETDSGRVIIISDTDNQPIFNVISNRLEKSTEVVFY